MSYRLKDGRVSAFYGDTDVVLQVFEKNATEVQFKKNETDTWDLSLTNNEVTIPNEFFNGTYSRVNFYITDGTYTISRGEIEINPRVLPTDYIENPTRVKTYSDILKIMEEYKVSATEGVAEIEVLKTENANYVGESKTNADTAKSYSEETAKNAEAAKLSAENAKTSEESVSSYLESIKESEARIDKKAVEVADLAARKGDKGDTGTGISSITTQASTTDGGANSITVILTDGTSKTFDVLNGSKGSQGIQGIQGEKGDKGDTGEQGIQGEKGDTGIQGIQGEKGDTGLGISSISTNEVSADEGANTVTITLTDNTSKTFTVKNGSKGSKGDKGDLPVKGTDYWTESDKAEIVNSVLAQIENFSTEAF